MSCTEFKTNVYFLKVYVCGQSLRLILRLLSKYLLQKKKKRKQTKS